MTVNMQQSTRGRRCNTREPMRCSICNQPILPGESFDRFEPEPYHDDARDCIAAVVRRCVEIAEGGRGFGNAADNIRAEFKGVLHG